MTGSSAREERPGTPVQDGTDLPTDADLLRTIERAADEARREGNAGLLQLITQLQQAFARRRQADDSLRESEQRYRDMFEKNQAIKLLIDPMTMLIVDANPAACEFYGYPRDVLTRMTLHEINMLSQEDLAGQLGRAMVEQRSYFYFRHRLASGAVRDVEIHSGPVPIGGRQLLYSIVHDITERKQAEAQVRRQLAFTNAITGSLGEGVYALDREARLTFMNPAAERMLGWTTGELLGRPTHELIHFQRADGTLVPPAECPLLQGIREGRVIRVDDDVYTRKDGTMFPVAYTSAPIVLDGTVVGTVVAFRDMTGPKQAEETLRESEAKYRLLFEANPHAMWVYDVQTLRFLAVNATALERYGYSRADFLDMDIGALAPPEDRAALRAWLAGPLPATSGGGTWRHQTRGGADLWVDVASHALVFEGRPARLIIATDITEKKHAEEALRESEEKYRELIENANDIIYTHDFQGNFTSANAAALRTFGYTSAEISQLNIATVIDAEHLAAAHQRIQEKLRRVRSKDREPALPPYVVLARTKAGQEVWIEVNSRLLWDKGRPVGVQGIARDVTERKRSEQALRDSEEKYRLLADSMEDLISLHELDGRFAYVSPSYEKRLKRPAESLIGQDSSAWVHPDDRARFRALTDELIAERRAGQIAWRRKTDNGEDIWFETLITPIYDATGAPFRILCSSRDITERKRAEAQLRLQATALESAANAIAITDRRGVMTWINPAFTRLTGYTAEEAIGQNPRLLRSGMQDDGFYTELWSTIMAGQVWYGELVNRRKDGSLYTEEQTITPVRDEHGEIAHFITIKQDVTERKHHEQKITYLASHDPLTGLPNRRALEENLERVVARARRGLERALLFLDLDNFKLVNDTMGHAAGDQLLVTLTGLLAEHVRDGDLISRQGGDEFAVLLEGTSLAQARQIAERMRTTVDAFRFQFAGHSFELGVSIGLVPVTGQQTSQVLLAQADIAMYSAKQQGRNRVMIYQPDEGTFLQLSEANQWVRRIKDALREDRLLLYFQPVARLSDSAVVHYEALIRMRGEAGEIISPGAFISAAERFGLMPPLDRWLVRQVVRTLADRPDIHLFMNLSGCSLLDEELLEFIETELRTTRVAPERLGFEITETAAVQDLVRAERWIRRVKALGCRFALDDFGVGFTSFAYLRSLPVDQIKIDGSFIRTLEEDVSNRNIVQAMHTLANSLGKETVAEFVETAAVWRILREIGVTYGQGFYKGGAHPDLPGPDGR
jgi:diguanylate cyclase (GGDEF)-like protein/PAS domain S-box-containing protein